MAYDLETFTADCHRILKRDPGPAGRDEVRRDLERLIAEPSFLATYCTDVAPGLTVLYEDPELGFQVLRHVNSKGRKSPPHDHGASWAIYGQATKHTDMTEWQRTDDGRDPAKGSVKPEKTYRLTPGHAGIYQDGKIHSIDFPDNSIFIRVTGTNLDKIMRIAFNLETGQIRQMTPQTAA
jgi:predicted metal-dependent enzyme (double-stranded beta helix superfamily)